MQILGVINGCLPAKVLQVAGHISRAMYTVLLAKGIALRPHIELGLKHAEGLQVGP